MLLKIHPDGSDSRKIAQVVDVLKKGGVIIYPTDTVYAIGCDITNQKAVERIAQFKNIKLSKKNLSFLCSDLSQLSDFARPLINSTFKLIKRKSPGPYTFILQANNNVPKLLKTKKKTVGIRIPDHNVCREIVRLLGNPIITTSLRSDDEILEYPTDAELIWEEYKDRVDMVVDSGLCSNIPSTVLDCCTANTEVLRAGKGDISDLL